MRGVHPGPRPHDFQRHGPRQNCTEVIEIGLRLLSIVAFRHARASALAPLLYIELIGAALIGYAAFDELPDMTTVVGAGLIVAAGLVPLRRHNQ
jgi:uncharacterized membrane protein